MVIKYRRFQCRVAKNISIDLLDIVQKSSKNEDGL